MDYNQPIPLYQSKPTYSIIIKQENPWQTPSTLAKPETVTVEAGQTLTSIAVTHNTTAQAVFNKNLDILDPDLIEVGQKVLIPLPDEKLDERIYKSSIYITPDILTKPQNVNTSGMFDTTGPWCTNYAARRHPVPASFRNADTWLIDARNAGIPTGPTPVVGSIAVAAHYMHVAIVEQIDGNRVFVSEQNYQGFGVVSQRWTPISEWQGYIY